MSRWHVCAKERGNEDYTTGFSDERSARTELLCAILTEADSEQLAPRP
jgi:hypothetical protein